MSNESEQEQLWKIYELLPEELQNSIFSVDTADTVWNVCEKYKINEVSLFAKDVGDSLMGLLPPRDFQEIIEKEFKLEPSVAKKATLEIDRFIFYPVRPLLDNLYHSKTTPPPGSPEDKTENSPEIQVKSEEKKTLRKDDYRESVESDEQ